MYSVWPKHLIIVSYLMCVCVCSFNVDLCTSDNTLSHTHTHTHTHSHTQPQPPHTCIYKFSTKAKQTQMSGSVFGSSSVCIQFDISAGRTFFLWHVYFMFCLTRFVFSLSCSLSLHCSSVFLIILMLFNLVTLKPVSQSGRQTWAFDQSGWRYPLHRVSKI